jgi:hypothetical protein
MPAVKSYNIVVSCIRLLSAASTVRTRGKPLLSYAAACEMQPANLMQWLIPSYYIAPQSMPFASTDK